MPNETNTEPSGPAKRKNPSNVVGTRETGRRPPTKRYFTDGTHLYEIVCRVQAYLLGRGIVRYVILRDCVTEATAKVDELQLAALSLVR
jgi:hypothetical protein